MFSESVLAGSPFPSRQSYFAPETLSYRSAHVVNRLFDENRKSISKILSSKKLLKM